MLLVWSRHLGFPLLALDARKTNWRDSASHEAALPIHTGVHLHRYKVMKSLLTKKKKKNENENLIHSLCWPSSSVAHTLVLFYQLVSLNVAINSFDHSLITLLISNQFVEIKGAVFKKFEKENLFQMSCAGKNSPHTYLCLFSLINTYYSFTIQFQILSSDSNYS
jgi:hypothetical protein